MERILTNLQVEWLTNMKILSEYEDDCFRKEDMTKKFYNLVENEYPGEEMQAIGELEVLRDNGFLLLEEDFSGANVSVTDVSMTKKGIDYLTMLQEDFAGRLATNEKIMEMAGKKDVMDYIGRISSAVSDIAGLIPSAGNFCQGAILASKSKIKMKRNG